MSWLTAREPERDTYGQLCWPPRSLCEGVLRCLLVVLVIVFSSVPAAQATVPKHWHASQHPRWFREALCIHSKEGAWNANTGNSYFGGAQFLESTWYRAGGTHYAAFDHPGDRRYPFTASPREQLYRMWIIVRSHHGSWSEWGTARACGLR